MRSTVAQRIFAATPEDVKIFTQWYADLVVRITTIMRVKRITQKSLAKRLDKQPSEIHKWLSGEHNFTLRSLAKLEAELGEPLLTIRQSEADTIYYEPVGSQNPKVIKLYQEESDKFHLPVATEWETMSYMMSTANVG